MGQAEHGPEDLLASAPFNPSEGDQIVIVKWTKRQRTKRQKCFSKGRDSQEVFVTAVKQQTHVVMPVHVSIAAS